MSARWTRWTAWILAAASFTSLVGAVALGLQRQGEDIRNVHPFVMTEAVFYASHARDQVDLNSFSQELVRVVGTTMQPTHASLWLRAEGSR